MRDHGTNPGIFTAQRHFVCLEGNEFADHYTLAVVVRHNADTVSGGQSEWIKRVDATTLLGLRVARAAKRGCSIDVGAVPVADGPHALLHWAVRVSGARSAAAAGTKVRAIHSGK